MGILKFNKGADGKSPVLQVINWFHLSFQTV